MKRIEWFKSNFRYMHVRLIEKELGFRLGTLQKWVQGERSLNEERIMILDVFLDGFLFGVGISEPNIQVVNAPVIEEIRERIIKEEKENPDPLLAVNREIVENRPVIKNITSSVLPRLEYEKRTFKNMKRLEPNINYNGEMYEGFIFKDSKFIYFYSEDLNAIKENLLILKK